MKWLLVIEIDAGERTAEISATHGAIRANVQDAIHNAVVNTIYPETELPVGVTWVSDLLSDGKTVYRAERI